MKEILQTTTLKLSLIAIILIVTAAGSWWLLRSPDLPASIAQGNGRIEATEIDIATKLPGRVVEVLAREGDSVPAGMIVARMDTQTLQAQKSEALAQVRYAESSLQTAKYIISQRESEHEAAMARVTQHRAEYQAASKHLRRSKNLLKKGSTPQQTVDDYLANALSIKAMISSAEAQVAATLANIEAAKSQLIQTQAQIDANKAAVVRIQADIEDSNLKAPRDVRIQYRIAEPGEVLGAGGRVLNTVDLTDVYMTFFLPTASAGKVALGTEIRLVLDAMPSYVIPAKASFVSSIAQFTPKTVETESERLKLMFRIRAAIAPELLKQHLNQVKAGLPGKAYVKLDPNAEWPANLAIRLPE